MCTASRDERRLAAFNVICTTVCLTNSYGTWNHESIVVLSRDPKKRGKKGKGSEKYNSLLGSIMERA